MTMRGEGVALRPMRASDLPAASALTAALGWPHRVEDWRTNLGLGHGLVAEAAGEVAGTVLGWEFGPGAAALGLMIVAEGQQGQGLGRRLMTAMLDRLGERAVMLTATKAGQPLYEKLGFVARHRILQHQGIAMPAAAWPAGNPRPAEAADRAAIMAMDRAATGLERAALLTALLDAGEGLLLERSGVPVGYAVRRRFGRGHVIGPVVAPDAGGARALIAHWLTRHAGAFTRLDVPEMAGIDDWLAQHGLPGTGAGVAMWRGTPPPIDGALVRFALISQAMG